MLPRWRGFSDSALLDGGVSKVKKKAESSWRVCAQKKSPISRNEESPSAICPSSITSSFPFLTLSLYEMFFFSSLSPAIAALIFFCFLANADHKPTVYKSKNYKPFKVTIQKPRMQVKKSAGKILRKSTLRLKPPSLPLEIFWEYGKVGFLVTCLDKLFG